MTETYDLWLRSVVSSVDAMVLTWLASVALCMKVGHIE
jgi:hypothetical protein